MPRSLTRVFALATLSVGALANAQMVPATNPASQPYPNVSPIQNPANTPQQNQQRPQIVSSQPIQGVWLRSEPNASVKTVSATANGTEIRVEHGRANVQVYRPVSNSQITVDMPGGQVALLKDGLYTFNADTNTVSVLHGEADGYPGGDMNAKPIKVKEDHEYAFLGKPKEVDPRMLAEDVLPGERGTGESYAPGGGYGYGEYGDVPYGYAPYPYYAYGWGYPYGFYPYYGLGFGYGGGFYGGFRGGYGGGFGGGFHGGGRR